MGEGLERGEGDARFFGDAEVAFGVPRAGGGIGGGGEGDFRGPRVAVGVGVCAAGDEKVDALTGGHAEVGKFGFRFGIVHGPIAEGTRAAGDDTGGDAIAFVGGVRERGFDGDDAVGGGDPAEDGGVRRGGAGVAAGGREREAAEGGVGEGGGGGQARDLVFLFAGAVGAVGERGEVVDAVLGGIVGAGAVSPAGGSTGGRRASEKF